MKWLKYGEEAGRGCRRSRASRGRRPPKKLLAKALQFVKQLVVKLGRKQLREPGIGSLEGEDHITCGM